MRYPRRFALITLAVLLALLALPASASALAWRDAEGGTVVIGRDEVIDDDLYVAGSTVDIRGTVNGSVFAAGNSVTVEGTVTGDVWAAGNNVRVSVLSSGTVHAAGSEVTVGGRIGRDLTAAGATVRLEAGSSVDRDAALVGSDLLVSGNIGRGIYAAGENLVVSGLVGRDINAEVRNLTLTENALVRGDVRYRSDNTAEVREGAQVDGRVRRSAPTAVEEPTMAERVALAVIAWVRRLIGLLLFGVAVVLLFPRFTRRAAERIGDSPLKSLGLGFVVLFLTPIAAFLVFLLGLLAGGWWIAFVILALYFVAVALATIVTAVFLGRMLAGRVSRGRSNDLIPLLAGLLVLTALEAVPVLGVFVRVTEVLFGLGAIALALLHRGERPAEAAATGPVPAEDL